ncbi:MAG: segregation/condensation protein A [Candidatus Aenigmarchaeota archaeon]|nr:segregation/condensation protein A [Candidatus Aenigmarchaeota archaeon]
MRITIDEAGIVDLASKEASWEEVLEYVIHEEGMDPWDIDVVKLADAFRTYVERLGTLDFKVPARLIIIAAALLHLKAEVLILEEEQKAAAAAQAGPPIDLSKIPELQVPVKRAPTRRVTLDELVGALEKAFRTQERRAGRIDRARERVEEVVGTEEQFDVMKKIDELFVRINDVVERLHSGTMPFSSLVPRWERKEIVQSLLGILHISNDGRVELQQEEPFKEIYVKIVEGNAREEKKSEEEHIDENEFVDVPDETPPQRKEEKPK